MKTYNDIITGLIQARTDAAELSSSASELEDRLNIIQGSLAALQKSETQGVTITWAQAASIKVWLKAARRSHGCFSAEPTPELDKLIDLLPGA